MTETITEDDTHQCHFCGTWVSGGFEHDVDCFNEDGTRKRHWLSDCRPDLVQHDIGPLCTWPLTGDAELDKKLDRPGCYAYQIFSTQEWTNEHTHFHKDGPM